MALLDPTNHSRITHRSGADQPTNHPGVCVAAGFAFLVAVALAFHFAFNALT